jgi:hypothetical protein
MKQEISPAILWSVVVIVLLAVVFLGWRSLSPGNPVGVQVPATGPSPMKAATDRK